MAFRYCATLVSIFFALDSPTEIQDDESTVFNEHSIGPSAAILPFILLPGTKWCGPGNGSEDNNDLGIATEIDICCRTHDNCTEYISGYDDRHGLHNPDQFTRLHCDCEQEFLNCLQNVDTYTATAIGVVYFAFQKYCFKYEHPIVKCTGYQNGFLFSKRCIRYKFDITKVEQWQWFENPFYPSN